MKTILITGANGQLGRALTVLFEKKNDVELYLTDVVSEGAIHALDITNEHDVHELVQRVTPYAIINCAALTNVDGCEKELDLAYRINAIGPRNLAIAAKETGAKLVHISTDYVFSGDGNEPYTEFDAPAPKSAYGKTKLEGERFVQQLAERYFIIRTAWLYGDGKNFVKTMLRLSETRDEVSVVCDQIGSPTSTRVLADIIDTLIWTENYGLYHGTCEGICSWADFTEEIFRLAGKSTKVNHITSKQYSEMNPAAADRPAYSVLDNYMLKQKLNYVCDDWKTAIAEYMNNIPE